jgi:chromosome segregation ATPase
LSSPIIHPQPQDSGGGFKIPILFGIVIALLGAIVYLFIQLDQVRTEMTKLRESILNEVSNLRESSSVSSQTSRRHLDSLRAELEAARRQAASAAGQAKEDATKHAEEVARRLEDAQKRQAEQVKTELSRVEQTAASKIGEVSTEVGSVKQEVAANKNELEKTIADLKSVRGDLGEQSGLIATNGRELSALKALGDRSYYEFNLVKAKQPTKISDITVLLKKADVKANKYTIELVADDKRFEKKDKNVNEPVQFYISKYRQPCEIVVNEIKKDRVVGYLSQPKVQAPRTTGGSSE